MHSVQRRSWPHRRWRGTKRWQLHLPQLLRHPALLTLPGGSGMWRPQAAIPCRLGSRELGQASGRWHRRAAGAALQSRSGEPPFALVR